MLPQFLSHQQMMTISGNAAKNAPEEGSVSSYWMAYGGVATGANHIRQNMPCQDAFFIKEDKNFLVAAVADGHGSSRCKYSHIGSGIAVEVVCEFLADLMKSSPDIFSQQKDIWIPKKLETAWKHAVFSNHNDTKEQFSYELYGTTLLAVLVSDDFIFILQIGDGDIIAISDGNAYFLFNDTAKIGEDTESLCMEESWKYIKTKIISTDSIDMLMLSSDGYSNSFITESDFFQAGVDLCKLWEDKDRLKENLPVWLSQTSQKGSGDDITVVLIKKTPAL